MASSPDSQDPLVYPFERTPATGEAVAIAEGVLWLRMPLPLALNHINVWALADEAGWTIVDTGLATPETTAAWERCFADVLGGRPVVRVICTHMHPDHVGMAGWLGARFDCRLWMTRLEYITCRSLAADTGRPAPVDGVRFYRAAGWDEPALETYRQRFGQFGRGIHAFPDSYQRLTDGQELAIGAQRWRVVVGNGHSPEHACLHCPELGLFISGDQVLPRISSNVSLFPTEPGADPLGDWLESLRRLRSTVPADVLVLPAHGGPFRGLHTRLDRLRDDHERGLADLESALAQPRRVVDLFEVLFRRPIRGQMLLGMATGECLAHLMYLVHRDRVVRARDADGVDWYRRAA